jgi:hypothetical protein
MQTELSKYAEDFIVPRIYEKLREKGAVLYAREGNVPVAPSLPEHSHELKITHTEHYPLVDEGRRLWLTDEGVSDFKFVGEMLKILTHKLVSAWEIQPSLIAFKQTPKASIMRVRQDAHLLKLGVKYFVFPLGQEDSVRRFGYKLIPGDKDAA